MRKISALSSLFLILVLTLLTGCGGGGSDPAANVLSPSNVNLIFVVSPDLFYNGGDIDPATANLTGQGLERSLRMATYLRQQVLRSNNATAIYALEPMTHLQTADNYPDMAPLGYIEQFALLNQFTELGVTANSFPLFASYNQTPLPAGVGTPNPATPLCQGLDFADTEGDNDTLAAGIINANRPGFYVFSAPWETISALMETINSSRGYGLSIPPAYQAPDYIYAISITASGQATFTTYDAGLNPPPSAYPTLPAPVQSAACNVQQPYFSITNQGIAGSSIPGNANRNETVYLIRHAEAHPSGYWDDGNYIGAGQWRALYLPYALQGKISPDLVYSIDPAQGLYVSSTFQMSYVRPALTVLPYTIFNNMPLNLVYSIVFGTNNADPAVAQATSDFFFTGGTFSGKTILVAWEHDHFPPLLTYLFQTYNVQVGVQTPALTWPPPDYDTIWRVTLDGSGNLTVDNQLCEGIDSASLPAEAPMFY